MPGQRLPGFATIRRRRGRNELAVDAVAGLLRELGDYNAHRRAFVTLARTTGAALDRLEADPDRSEHVVGNVARVHAIALEHLTPAPVPVTDDWLDRFETAVRDPAPA